MQHTNHTLLAVLGTGLLLLGVGCSNNGIISTSPSPISTSSTDEASNAQPIVNAIMVSDQSVKSGSVTIDRATIDQDGWVAIHQSFNGKPGLIIGAAHLMKGENDNVVVPIKVSSMTAELIAMLHMDKGVIGKFEFSAVDPAIMVNGQPVMQSFKMLSLSSSSSTPPAATTSKNTTASTVKTITLTARQFAFEPNVITVAKGDHVLLKITSTDVPHGFSLPDFNVNVSLPPGQTQTVEFDADKSGTYTFMCSVFCGDGHSGMRGTLIVQ